VVLLGILLAQAISPLVNRLGRLGFRPSWAVLTVYTGLGLVIGALLWLLAGTLAGEAGELSTNLPGLQNQLVAAIDALPLAPLRAAFLPSVDGTAPPRSH